MEEQPGDAPAVENHLPPLNSPVEPVNSLPLPSKFLGGNNQTKQTCARYRIASGIQNKSNQERVGTFLYSIGDCADDIVKTLSIREATVSFDEVKTAPSGYFAARRKTPVNPWTPLFKIYTASPKSVSTEL